MPAKLDPEATEALRLRLERTLLDMHAALDALTGYRDAEPMRAPDPPAQSAAPAATASPAKGAARVMASAGDDNAPRGGPAGP